MSKHQVSFEFFPPKTETGLQRLLEQASYLAQYDPKFFSVTFGAGGSTQQSTFQTVQKLIEIGHQSIAPHLSCIAMERQALNQLLSEYQALGIKRMVALRGDRPSGSVSMGDLEHAIDLVHYIHEQFPGVFDLEIACYPEVHPESAHYDDDFKYFVEKAKAGAKSAITQYFYNADAYFHFVDKCSSAGLDIPIIPGIMPIHNHEKLVRFSKACGAEIPRWLNKQCQSYDNEQSLQAFGVDFVSKMCDTLLSGGAPGLHFYTLNHAQLSSTICQNLNLASLNSYANKNISPELA